MFATTTKSKEHQAYCKLQVIGARVAEMIYLLRTYEADDALVSEAVNVFKMIDELKGTIDDMFLDGYFKELNERFEKKGL